VPFINPVLSVSGAFFRYAPPVFIKYMQWDPKNKSDVSKWNTQHGMLKLLDAPYVYNVFKGDKAGFVKAIKDAIANPIERWPAFIVPFLLSSPLICQNAASFSNA
jgi:hypothetical protein